MTLAGAAMVYSLLQYRKGNMWGKPVAIIAAIIAIIFAFSTLFTGGGSNIEQLATKSQQYQKIAVQKLGSYLASEYPNAKTVILSHIDYSSIQPDTDTEQLPNSVKKFKRWEEELKEVADGQLDITNIIHPKLPAQVNNTENAETGAGDTSRPTDYRMFMGVGGIMQAKYYNKALSGQLNNCDLLIMLRNPPYDIEKLKVWQMSSPPKVALMHPGMLSKLKESISRGFITAVVTHKPDANNALNKPVPKDMEEAFNKRYLLITPKNIDKINQKFKNLFQ